jgi:hypothetical protein
LDATFWEELFVPARFPEHGLNRSGFKKLCHSCRLGRADTVKLAEAALILWKGSVSGVAGPVMGQVWKAAPRSVDSALPGLITLFMDKADRIVGGDKRRSSFFFACRHQNRPPETGQNGQTQQPMDGNARL